MAGKRTGNGVGPQLSETLERVCVDAEVLVGVGKGNEQAKRRVAVAQEALDEKMDNIRGAVTMGEKVEREMRMKTYLTTCEPDVQCRQDGRISRRVALKPLQSVLKVKSWSALCVGGNGLQATIVLALSKLHVWCCSDVLRVDKLCASNLDGCCVHVIS